MEDKNVTETIKKLIEEHRKFNPNTSELEIDFDDELNDDLVIEPEIYNGKADVRITKVRQPQTGAEQVKGPSDDVPVRVPTDDEPELDR